MDGRHSSGWELDVDFLFFALFLQHCLFCVENWREEWIAVLWLGAGCGFSLFGSSVNDMFCVRTGEENGWESFGWELVVDFLFLAVKLMIWCGLQQPEIQVHDGR